MAEITQFSSANWWPALTAGWGGFVAIFALAGLVFYLFARLVLRTPTREDVRIEDIHPDSAVGSANARPMFGTWTQALAAQIPESDKERREFELLLRQAGMYAPQTSETIYAWRFVLLVAPLLIAGVCAIFFDSSRTFPIMVAGGLTAIGLAILPRVYVYLRRRRRMRRIREAIPDALDMLGMCVSGGLELSESLDHVARRLTAYPECAQELMLLKRHAELGGLNHALQDFAKRVDLPETDQLAGLLLRGSHLGTELVGSLAQQAEHLRVARRQSASIQANKTPVKLIFPIMFCFAPAALILLTAPAVVQLRDFLTGRTTVETMRRDMSAARSEVGFSPQYIAGEMEKLGRSRENFEQSTKEPSK